MGNKSSSKFRKYKSLDVFDAHNGGINAMELNHNHKYLVTASEDRSVRVWSTLTSGLHLILEGHQHYISSICVHGDYIITGSADSIMHKWNIDTGECVSTYSGHVALINEIICWNNWIFSTSYDSTIRCWHFTDATCELVLQEHTRSVGPIAIVPNVLTKSSNVNPLATRMIITGSVDKTAKLWDLQTTKAIVTYEGHKSEIVCLTVDHHNKYLYTGSSDATLRSWEIYTGQAITVFKGHVASITCIKVNRLK